MKEGFLTKDDFLKVYEKCGRIMHNDNPFASKVDYEYSACGRCFHRTAYAGKYC